MISIGQYAHSTSLLNASYILLLTYLEIISSILSPMPARVLLKVKEYGINGFLSNRRQCVSINGSFSQLSDVTSGVPQCCPCMAHYCSPFM